MTQPQRIQLSRVKGFRLQEASRALNGLPAVKCDRSSKHWGNPCRVGTCKGYTAADAVADYRRWIDREPNVRSFENVYGKPPSRKEIVEALKGKNLACWCKPGDPCHVTVQLEIANAPICEVRCAQWSNPSTADAETDDPTIRKVKGFSERAGYGHIIVGNLFAFRATDIKQLRTARDPNGPDNDRHIEQIMRTLMLVARPNSDSWPARRWRKSGLAPKSQWRTLWLTLLANQLEPI